MADIPSKLPSFVSWPSFPFEGQLRTKRLDAPVAEEPPREGEDPSACTACQASDEAYIWVSDRWRVRAMDRPSGLPMVLILESRSHLDLGDLTNLLAAELGVMTVRLERAIRSLDTVERVHVNRWGDGAAHFHMWFLARPVGQLQLRGSILSLWDDILEPIPESQWRESLAHVAAWLADFGGRSLAEPPRIEWHAPSHFGEVSDFSDESPAEAAVDQRSSVASPVAESAPTQLLATVPPTTESTPTQLLATMSTAIGSGPTQLLATVPSATESGPTQLLATVSPATGSDPTQLLATVPPATDSSEAEGRSADELPTATSTAASADPTDESLVDEEAVDGSAEASIDDSAEGRSNATSTEYVDDSSTSAEADHEGSPTTDVLSREKQPVSQADTRSGDTTTTGYDSSADDDGDRSVSSENNGARNNSFDLDDAGWGLTEDEIESSDILSR